MIKVVNRLSLKLKLMSFIGLILMISIGIVSFISFTKSKEALTKSTEDQLQSNATFINNSLKAYLNRSLKFTENLSRNRLVEGLIIAYESSFFGSNFEPGEDLNIDNEFYQKLDKMYADRKKKLIDEFQFKDLLLVSLDSQIIFTANNNQKEQFLGRSFENGAFKDTPLAECSQKALDSEDGTLFFTGFVYDDITKAVNGFICGKKKAEFASLDDGIEKGDDIGIIIVQLDTDYINSLLTSRIGMGETGQSYLVGSDLFLRSDFYLQKDKFNAINSIHNKMKINSKFVSAALDGKDGLMHSKNVLGSEVLASYRPFDFMEKKYALITEKASEEVFSSVFKTLNFTVILSLIAFALIMFLTALVTKSILKPIEKARDILSDVSNNLQSNAKSLEDFSDSLLEGAESTSSSIHQTVSTMNQLGEMVNQTLSNVKKAADTSDDVCKSVSQGKAETDQMKDSVNEISDNSQKMVDTINEINKNMQEFKEVILNISEKTNIIHDIVSQTKLLSFNASVEAARAGELGKGFAVVAEEVGNLASASGSAAEEIGKLITNSVENVEKMLSEMTTRVEQVKHETKVKIDNGLDKAKLCENSLNLINNHIDGMSSRISEINTASNEQATGIREVTSSMANLSQTAQKTESVANDTLKYSKEISTKSEDLIKISRTLSNLLDGAQP